MSERTITETIFFAALDQATDALRAAYLDEACGKDKLLRQRIERLLEAYPQAGAFLERPLELAASVKELAEKDAETGLSGLDAHGSLDFLAPSQRHDSLGRIGHYEVLEVVGRGGMGIVLRAFDEKLQRIVAIKALAPALALSGENRQRFVREAQAAAAVTHDNVIAIHAVEDAGPVPYLVMQFIEGVTLQEKLDRSGPLPLNEILRIGLQMAAGLAAAHAQGLVHRDVKPANILLENGVERVKITDFGLAHAVDDASLAEAGLIAGTPAFMSPEQASGAHVDPRSDLFSLGSVLYALCTGQAPFKASTTREVLQSVRDATPKPIRQISPDVPEPLAAIIERLHAKDPGSRIQTAREVADALSFQLAELQQPAARDVPAPGPSARGRRTVWSVATAASLVIAAVGGTVAAYRMLRPDSLQREDAKLPRDTPAVAIAVLSVKPDFQLPALGDSHWMAQSIDGRLLAVPCGDEVAVFNARTGELIRTLIGQGAQCYHPAFSPDGARLASGCEDFRVRVWDIATGETLLSLQGHAGPVWTVDFDHEGKRLVSADARGTVKVWNTQGELLHSFAGHAAAVTQLAFSPDGRRLATVSLDGVCKIWDAGDWREIRSLAGTASALDAVAWSPVSKLLAAGNDNVVVLWSADAFELLHILKTPGQGMIAFTSDGSRLYTARCFHPGGEAHAFTKWDMATGTQQATYEMPTRGGYAFLHLDPDGRRVFVSQAFPSASVVRTYDAETEPSTVPGSQPPRPSGERGN